MKELPKLININFGVKDQQQSSIFTKQRGGLSNQLSTSPSQRASLQVVIPQAQHSIDSQKRISSKERVREMRGVMQVKRAVIKDSIEDRY